MGKRLFALFFLVFFVACSVRHQNNNFTNSENSFDKYIVQGNSESLASIAHKYTGSALNWKELAQLNPNLKSFRLKKGDEIIVPKGYLSRQKKSFNLNSIKERKNKNGYEVKRQDEMPFRSYKGDGETEGGIEEKTNIPLEDNLSSSVLIEKNNNNETIMFVGRGDEIAQKEPEVYIPYPEGKKYKRLRDDIINEFISDEE